MMKRLLCLVLCLMLAIPAALAETADTLPKLFARQLAGGNGARGYISISASGVADWLNLLLPFTASDIQVRAIGQKQGDMSETVTDDDDWQIHLYVKVSEGNGVGCTWVYGDPHGMYFQSELLPDTLLTIPVDNVHLLYQLFRGDFSGLFFAFDPMNLAAPGANGNASAYKPVADVLGIPEETWTAEWLPVLDKYFIYLDLWLAGYGEAGIGSETDGSMTMAASYTIPAEDFKDAAKYIIGQMMYDNDLLELLQPYVTMEQRITYLNPQMLYFYQACIDALPLNGDLVLSREMSALGVVVSTTVELPLPPLPDELTSAVGSTAQALFQLPYADLLDGVDRLTMTQTGAERTMKLSGSKRTITLTAVEETKDETTLLNGTISIVPAEDAQEAALNAGFSYSFAHRIYQDEKYLNHDTTEFSLAITPADADAAFQAVALAYTLDYRNNPNQQESPVQINLNVDAALPDANLSVEAVMRITTQMTMETLSTSGAQDATQLTDEQKAAMLGEFVLNMANTMSSLNASDAAEAVADAPALPAAEPTSVPPVGE